MRTTWVITAALLLLSSVSAHAGDSEPNPQKPAAPSGEFTPVLPATDHPNLKVIKGSGGVSTSSLIKNAPQPDDFVLGNRKAPLVIVEYASMTCPHCAHFSNVVLPEIEKNYIESGKVSYILRQFPINEPALKAAMLLECVGTQREDKYYVFSKVLFDAQSKWAFDGNYLSGLETIAMVGGLSREQFASCVNNTDREMQLLKIKKLAVEELKVPHTPYIFIGGEIYAGEHTIEAVSQFIDAKLAQVSEQKKAP
jgi:protein-disulfide isomerase